jgi:NRAMP (natural resistance-associated macrophage protein)-like metal ion transporter
MDKLKRFLKLLGPGFITGASDDDPSGIATYSQTGAQFGYTQLWTAIFSFPFMTIVQEMCGRIGIVTGKGLARLLKKHYPAPVLYFSVLLLFVANTINIGADLGAMAESCQLLFGLSLLPWLIGITLLTTLLQVFVPYALYSKFLKYLTLALFAYIVTALVVKQDWGSILHATVVPQFSADKDYLMNIVALLGTTISPYLFFWQTSEEVEKAVDEGKLKEMAAGTPEFCNEDIREMRLDTTVGMLFSQIVMFFIIVTTASTLGAHGLTKVDTAAQAAQALRPIAGDAAFALFALGILGTGLLAVPVLAASASYAISEAMGWREGLYQKPTNALGFFINFTGLPAFKMLYYTAVLNGLCAPPLMAMIILIANNPNIMGEHTNGRLSNSMGWMITALMAIAGFVLMLNLTQP